MEKLLFGRSNNASMRCPHFTGSYECYVAGTAYLLGLFSLDKLGKGEWVVIVIEWLACM